MSISQTTSVTSTGAQNRAINVGRPFGVYVVDGIITRNAINKLSTFAVHCKLCGAKHVKSGNGLYAHAGEYRRGKVTHCELCRGFSEIIAKPRLDCRTCDDCPALRPVNGVCRSCGEPGKVSK